MGQNITFVQKAAKKTSENQVEEKMFLVQLVHLEDKEKNKGNYIKKEMKKPKEEQMEELSTEINNCKKCELWKTRNRNIRQEIKLGRYDIK